MAMIRERKAEKAVLNVWLTQILKGNFVFFREMLNRVDGPVLMEGLTASGGASDDVETLRTYLDKPIRKKAPPKKKKHAAKRDGKTRKPR
jgi:hypothetical protein